MTRMRLDARGIVAVAVMCAAVLSARLLAAEVPEKTEPGGTLGEIGRQPGDDAPAPFVPARPLTEADKMRSEALAWYMTGELKQARSDFRGALEAFRKAAELDPNAVAIYRALVPLAFSLNQTEEAVKYALKAVELDPTDYRLLRRLGAHMAAQQQFPQALELLERAARSPALDKHSGAYVSLMRDLAVLYGISGDAAKTADCYEVVFAARLDPQKYQLDPQTVRALESDPRADFERIGQAFLEADRTELAVQAFERAAQARGGKPGALNYNLAQVYLRTNEPDKALAELQKYFDAQLQSKGRAAYQLLADILEKLQRSDELLGRLEHMAQQDARNSTLQYFLAEQYVAANRLDEAEKLYTRVLADSGDADGYAGLAAVYRRQGRADELLTALAKAAAAGRSIEQLTAELEAVAQDEKLLSALIAAGKKQLEADPPQLDFAAGYLLARMSAIAKNIEATRAFYRFAISARQDRAAVLFNELGEFLLEEKRYGEAAEVFRQAADHPALGGEGKPQFLFRLSQALEMGGNTEAALTAIKEAQTLLPDNPLLTYQEGWIHYHARHWDKAIELFERVIARFPQEKAIVRRCQFSVSNIYVQQGDMRKGEQILEDIYAEDPDDPSVNNDLGYLYADQGKNLEQAEKMIRKALEAEPENPAYLDSMGWVLYKLGKVEEAVTYLEKAVALPGGSDATILDHLADCYHKLGKTEQARELWQKALTQARADTRQDEKLIRQIEQKLK